ncbi:hypothetical protein [Altererythrobacter sp. Root672]|uniref:hypothetical protein n=1 Tax=Altererythrobacter sp. Root672 TaxID=1736584 RepID=UPI0006F52C67|nr:hypothetical protein [Altererythrobacter sp. Root672]KRA84175.1 hypothetical protein ASD76_09340 [Altererythrobacter sp. Root672]
MTAAACLCPNCGTALAVTLAAVPIAPLEPPTLTSDAIEPCLIADRLGLSEGYVRKLVKRGLAQGLAGFEKRGGRLYATTEAVKQLWGG